MHRYFVTGTDTDVGKTRVTAALALALKELGLSPTIVKLVQTGLEPGMLGDAARAGKLAGVRAVELHRFAKAADPWSAAIAEGKLDIHAHELVDAVAHVEHGLVAEGAGGLMVPLNRREHFGHVVAAGDFDTVLVVGLRLGCVNHALLTIGQLQTSNLPFAGIVLVERWGPTPQHYRDDVMRALQGKATIFGTLPFDQDEASSVRTGAHMFSEFLRG